MLDFLSKHAQKAYKEIQQITEQPDLLFSNDPTLIPLEARTNYRYIHGFTRLLRRGTLNIEDVTRSLLFVESKLDEYLKKIYKNKDFKFIIYGDIGIPGFTLTITSNYENQEDEGRSELDELVKWFHMNALYNGLNIDKEITEVELDGSEELKFKRYYTKIIKT